MWASALASATRPCSATSSTRARLPPSNVLAENHSATSAPIGSGAVFGVASALATATASTPPVCTTGVGFGFSSGMIARAVACDSST